MKLPICDPETKKYFERIVIDVDSMYSLATDIRKLGYDIKDEVEIKRATNLAERTEAILELPGLAKRYEEIMAVKKDRFPTIIQIFDEILDSKFGSFPTDEKRLEAAVRTALTLYTEGVVVAPLEGIPAIKISSNSDSTKYADIFYAGPIRAAGGTGTVLPIVLAYYGGKKLGLDRYKATESEIERYVEEYRIIGRKYARQIKVTENEIRHIIRECPVCVNGEATDPEEVDVYRNLERVPTNRLRGGAFLVLTEGVTLKAAKLKKIAKGFGFDWGWLDKFIKVKETGNTTEILPNYRYLEGAAAGRPVFSYPSRFGGFRLRYGRTRTTGLMAKALHPTTMYVLGGYAAVGTQLKVERPGKAAVIGACDLIEPSYVKLRDKSIVRAESKEWYESNQINVEKILFVGDMLISYGDFRKTAHPLMPPGYCEEWWALELEKELENKKLGKKEFESFLDNPYVVKEEDAVKLSDSFGVPLHPRYLYFYTQLNQEDIIYIRNALQKAERKYSDGIEFDAVLDYDEKLDFLFTKIVMPMKVENEKIIIKHGLSLFKTFGVFDLEKEVPVGLEPLDLLCYLSGLKIRDKAGSFIGARMGRPEAATERKMTGSPQVLFPIGKMGGNTRSINKAVDFKSQESKGLFDSKAASTVEIAFYKCPRCKKEIVYPYCWECKERTVRQYYCSSCNKSYDERKEKCTCGGKIYHSKRSSLSFANIFRDAVKRLGVEAPAMIKGVEGLVSIDKVAEPLEKGILRAKNGVYVFKDGVCRTDLLDFNLSHFKPVELKMTVEKARALGYELDIYGNELKDENQMLRLFPQDVILNTTVGDYLVKVATFVDDLLEKFYKKPKFYNAKVRDDLIGHYILALAPHIVAGIVGRVIGYSESRVMFSHPYFNTAKRRNCLTFDTPIVLSNNKNICLMEIGALDDGSHKTEIPLENTYTYSVDSRGKLHKRKVIALYKQKNKEKILKLKTRFGREVKVTPKQKILYGENGLVKYKFAKDLKIGDNLLSLANAKYTKNNELNILEYYLQSPLKQKIRVHNIKKLLKPKLKKDGYVNIGNKLGINWKKLHTAIDFDAVPLDLYEKLRKQYKIADDGLELSYNKQKSRIPCIIGLTKELGWIVGYYLADGHARTSYGKSKDIKKYVYQVNFVSAEKEITNKLMKITKKLFNRNLTKSKQKSVDDLYLSGRVYYDLFVNILQTGKGARNKRVPQIITNSNSECIKGCIGGYVVGDGHIEKTSITAISVNKNLINEFAYLCATQNLFAHVFEEKERTIKTGLVKEYYQKRNKSITVKSYGFKLYSKDFKEMVQYLFGSKFKKAIQNLKSIEIKKKRVSKLGNFIIDKLVSIKEVPYNGKYVYDLIVEKEKTFIGGYGNLGIYDCDGDQDSAMLLLDVFLNFSKDYLPSTRGGKQDTPLVATIVLDPQEIDDEAYEMETTSKYTLEFYESALKKAEPVLKFLNIVGNFIGTDKQFTELKFTHDTAQYDVGPKQSSYTLIKEMKDKISNQLDLQYKITAVDHMAALELVLSTHFLPDIIGNARKYARQGFRCTKCNKKFRRMPLLGSCSCGGNINLTIAQGSVRKYLGLTDGISKKYKLTDYLDQRIKLIYKEVDSLFNNEKIKQKSLGDFM